MSPGSGFDSPPPKGRGGRPSRGGALPTKARSHQDQGPAGWPATALEAASIGKPSIGPGQGATKPVSKWFA